MRMRVDEPGQEQAIARVDDPGVGRSREPGRAHRADGVAFEKDVAGLAAMRGEAQDAAAADDLEGARVGHGRYRSGVKARPSSACRATGMVSARLKFMSGEADGDLGDELAPVEDAEPDAGSIP